MNDATLDLLRAHLQMAVPLFILEFLEGRRRLEFSRPDLVQAIAQHGDHILYRGEHTAEAVSALCEAIATLAFCPGGVTVFSMRFEVPPEAQGEAAVNLGRLLSFAQEVKAAGLESAGSHAGPGRPADSIQVSLFDIRGEEDE